MKTRGMTKTRMNKKNIMQKVDNYNDRNIKEIKDIENKIEILYDRVNKLDPRIRNLMATMHERSIMESTTMLCCETEGITKVTGTTLWDTELENIYNPGMCMLCMERECDNYTEGICSICRLGESSREVNIYNIMDYLDDIF